MTYRKRFLALILTGAFAFAFLPAINLTALAQHGKLTNGIFDIDLRSLWSTDAAEGYIAFGLIKCCGRSYRQRQVAVGTDGYLFLGNSSDEIMDKVMGRNRPPTAVVDTWLDGLLKLQAEVEAKGGHFLFVFAPNKVTIYPENLPETGGHIPSNIADDIVERAALKAVPLLDLRDVFKKAKSDVQLYYRTDTHWTHAGAAIGYQQIIGRLNSLYGLDLMPIEHALRPFMAPAGDLARMLKIVDILGPEQELDYAFDLPPQVICRSFSDIANETAADCTGDGAVGLPAGNQPPILVTRMEGAINPQTVLMICDSFCEGHSQLFNTSFKTVYRLHINSVNGDDLLRILDKVRPDIAILQVVERNMLSPQLAPVAPAHD